MGTEIIMRFATLSVCANASNSFERDFKFLKIAEIKMCIQQVVHSFYIMPCFHSYHQRLRFKKIDPFLSYSDNTSGNPGG